MAPTTEPVLPPELWAHVMQYCSAETLKALALVSRSCCEDARKCLYRCVHFAQGWKYTHRIEGTRIRDLAKFRHSLSHDSAWRSSVKHARLCWTNNGSPQSWREPDRSETDAEAQLNCLVRDTANLLAESTVLQTLHLSIPLLDSRVPFSLTRLDSLTIPITNCLHNDPDFAKLLKFFQMPSLKHVELDQMLRLNVAMPEDCCQPRTSDVTHLVFTQCGPVHGEISHLLSWPRDLQKLEFGIGMAEGLTRFAYDSGSVDMTITREALRPVEHCLQDLTIAVFDDEGGGLGYPVEEDAFQSFAKLQRLNVPIEMFLELSACPPAEPVLPIHTLLPSSLEELVLQISSDFWWGDWDEMQPSEEMEYLVSYLSGLATHKDQCLPHLKEVRISRGFYEEGRGSTSWIPLDCEHTQQFTTRLGSSGISVSFC